MANSPEGAERILGIHEDFCGNVDVQNGVGLVRNMKDAFSPNDKLDLLLRLVRNILEGVRVLKKVFLSLYRS